MAIITLEHRVVITYDIGDENPNKTKNALASQMFAAVRREHDNGALSTDNTSIDRWDMTTSIRSDNDY